MIKAMIKSAIGLLSIVIMAAALACCVGGGTTGSDGGGPSIRELRLEGVLQDSLGEPLPNAELTVLDTGDTAISDQDGRFQIALNTAERSLELEAMAQSVVYRVVLEDLPAEDCIVSLVLSADSGSASLVIVSISIAPLGQSSSPSDSVPASEAESSEGASSSSGRLETLIQGRLRVESLGEVAGASVRIPEFGVSDRTDARGQFNLSIPPRGGRHRVEVKIGALRAGTTLPKLPPRPVVVTVELLLRGSFQAVPTHDPSARPPSDVRLEVKGVNISD